MVENSFQGVFYKKDRIFLEVSRRDVEGVDEVRKDTEKPGGFCPQMGVKKGAAEVNEMWKSLFSTFYSLNNGVKGVEGSIQTVR